MKILTLAGLVAGLLSGTAIAQTSSASNESWMDSFATGGQWYLGASAGGNWVGRHTKLDRYDLGSPVQTKATYDDGYIGSIVGGYGFANGFRLQLDLADRYNQVDQVYGYGQGRGSMRSYSAMVDALYDIPVDFALKPYVGFGVGAATYAPDHIRGDGMPYPAYFGSDRTGVAVQGIAGVAYNIDDNIALTLEYRYFVRPGDHPTGVNTDYQSNSALIGVRYSFGAPVVHEEAEKTYVPAPAVAPAQNVPRNYLVFFDFNKSDLTSDARGIVDKAASNAHSSGITQLEVTGYTDTVGSDAYNMRLSRRRAESVSAELQTQGVPANEIAIYAKGKHDLLVPTADGVREPQNRRVQIVFSAGGANPSS
jgi:outer membrane protein OmpA-like peptidoglycan-associated protein